MDDKYLEYFAAMVDELKKLNQKADALNQRVDTLNSRMNDLNGRIDALTVRVEKLEKQQAKTNLILNRIDRDLMTLVEDSPRYEKTMEMEVLKTSGKKQQIVLRKG